MTNALSLRTDLAYIEPWFEANQKVLDLGCGDGQLLHWLTQHKQIRGVGLEIDPDNLNLCIGKGLNVIEQNLDHGLENFADDSFDVVVMTQALQALHHPHLVLKEMLRIGKSAIVTFPNFGHWRCRAYLSTKGMMPVSEFMPYEWYDTPNIHFCTFADFEKLCEASHAKVLRRQAVDQTHQSSISGVLWPNLFGEVAIYQLTRGS